MREFGKKLERFLVAATFAEGGDVEATRHIVREGRSIVVAIRAGQVASPALGYALTAAERNNARLEVLFIESGETGHDGMSVHDEELVSRAAIPVRVSKAAGSVKAALIERANISRDVLFFVVDSFTLNTDWGSMSEAAMRRFAQELGKPIVNVENRRMSKTIQAEKEITMAPVSNRKKPVGKMLVMGLISIALYTLLLTKQDVVNSTFGRGGWYALLPIATAFVFSFIHGAFTGDFWTVLGVEAAKKKKEVK